jgi:hypothetical protein
MRGIFYNEIAAGHNFPLMKDSLQAEPYRHKNEIAKYLRSGNVEFARVSRAKDVFTGEIIPHEALFMNDGVFCWSSELAWYVEKYNLRLPKEFEDHILKNIFETNTKVL